METIESIKGIYRKKYRYLPENRQKAAHISADINKPKNASHRLHAEFLELLEYQFPINEPQQHVQLRSASEFAEMLHVHVNSLNRAVKEVSRKTTTRIIAERVLREAKLLLKQTFWTVSEIAFSLGFTETTHFNNFFKKHIQMSPVKFRNTNFN